MIAVDTCGGLHVGLELLGSALSCDLTDIADVDLSEFEFRWVNKASLDEGAGLARAFAVIGRIDETTVVAEVFAEVAARAGEDLAEVSGRDLNNLCAHFIADLEDLAQDEDQALAAVEAEQGSDHAVVPCLFSQYLYGDGDGARVGWVEVGDPAKPGGGHGKGADGIGCGPFGFLDAQQVVDSNAIEPGAELRLAPKAMESLDGFQQDILCGVFGIVAAVEHAEREVEEPREVAGEQELELGVFAGSGAGCKVFVGVSGRVIEERVWKDRYFRLHKGPPMDKTTGSRACDSC